MIIRLICLLLLISSVHTLRGQDAWFTDVQKGLAFAKSSNKTLLIEVGSIGENDFIGNEVWNSDTVLQQLQHYVPVTIVLDYQSNFYKKHRINFTPAILIMDENENMLFMDYGLKTKEELADILRIYHVHGFKIKKLLKTYARDKSVIGGLQLAEEYLFLAMLAPPHLKSYFYQKSVAESKRITGEFSTDEKDFKQRSQIIEWSQEMLGGDTSLSIKSLKKLQTKELNSQNLALSHYYLAIAYAINADPENSQKSIDSLSELQDSQRLARDYLSRFQLLTTGSM